MRALNKKTGEKFNEVDLKRITPNDGEETGFITCQADHKCMHLQIAINKINLHTFF